MASSTSLKEAVLRGGNPEFQEDWVTALHIPIKLEEASEPEGSISPGVRAADPQNMLRWIPPPPLGFALPLAIKLGPPPLGDAETTIGMPRGAWLDLTCLSSIQITVSQNDLTGELEYHYKARVVSRMSLHLTLPHIQDQPGINQELKDQLVNKPLLTYT